MSPWLSDSEIGLFCKDPLISSLGGCCLADSENTCDDQESAGEAVHCRTIFLKAVLHFDQSQSQDGTWFMCFPLEMYTLATKGWQGQSSGLHSPGLSGEGLEGRGRGLGEVPSGRAKGLAFQTQRACHRTRAANAFLQSKVTAFWKSHT